MTHKPGPDTEVERGEHQGEVEVVPGGQWVEELEEPGERRTVRTVRLQPGQSQTAHTDEDQQGKYKLKLNVNKNPDWGRWDYFSIWSIYIDSLFD